METLTGTHLTIALSRTCKPIELRDIQGTRIGMFADNNQPGVATFPLEELFSYIARGYEIRGTKRRIRYISPPRPKKPIDHRIFLSDPSFWAGRGCIRWWADQVSPGMQSRV